MQKRRRRHGPASAMDCISGLPDELLHDILLRLNSTRAAGRTSVLSRRWRNVWATLPQLVFDGDGYGTGSDSAAPPAASFLDSVDGALRAYSAPTIDVLDISQPSGCPAFPARRVGSWLRFASRRMARTLSLDVPWSSSTPGNPRKAEVLVLPTIDGAQYIWLSLGKRWLRIRPAGVFVALTDLTIGGATMEGRVLEALVCSQCPRLRDLRLLQVTLAPESDISLRSDSLETLSFWVVFPNRHRLEIVAPKMEQLCVCQLYSSGARISAPKLAELVWEGYPDFFGSDIQFVDASRHLRVLEVSEISGSLMQRFDKVDELRLEDVNISRSPSCPLPCPCRLPESCKADDITLDSLEVVEIYLNEGSPGVVEFVKQLSQCNAAILKKVVIGFYNKLVYDRFCAQIRGVCRPNIKVEFVVLDSDG
uniref:F-box domain-containing protein n=1 Tax=Setaria italica TaxID=4555 RepID=K4A1E6_SETIT